MNGCHEIMKKICVAGLLVCLSALSDAASTRHRDVTSDIVQDVINSNTALVAAVGSTVLFVVLIVVVFGCADMCRRQQGFQDFHEDAFNSEVIEAQPAGQFTMYPPIESTPESYSTGPVVFEPLPDLTPKIPQVTPNRIAMRPKVRKITADQGEITGDTSVQQKLKLQSILSTTQLQLPREQLHFIKELGTGWFGQVLQGEGQNILPGHRKTKLVIQRLKEDGDHRDQLAFLEEAVAYWHVNHNNTLRVYGLCTEVSPFLVVLELCPFGDLKTYLRSHRVAVDSFNEKGLLLKFACDIAAGVMELHNNGLVHHDFAARNCLLGSDLTVKVGDYGLGESTFPDDYYKDRHGDSIPIRWLAPECVECKEDSVYITKFTKEANIWSYGVVLWEILTFGKQPYEDMVNDHVIRLVLKEQCVKLTRPSMPISYIDRIHQLMQLCWSEPETRPSLRELRIMFLHLLASKGSSQSSLFEQKWNQLMPRKPAGIVNVAAFREVDSGRNKTDPAPVRSAPIGGSAVSSEQIRAEKKAMSLDQDVLAAKVERPKKESTPINELSLEAELAAVGGGMPSPVKAANVSSVNEALEEAIEEIPGRVSDNHSMPDVVPAGHGLGHLPAGKPDFVTSTPKRDGDEQDMSRVTETPSQNKSDSSRSEYVTALSSLGADGASQLQTIMDSASEGTKMFASYLQTVTTSIDLGDDSESIASSFKSNLHDLSSDSVFENGRVTPIGSPADSDATLVHNMSTRSSVEKEPASLGKPLAIIPESKHETSGDGGPLQTSTPNEEKENPQLPRESQESAKENKETAKEKEDSGKVSQGSPKENQAQVAKESQETAKEKQETAKEDQEAAKENQELAKQSHDQAKDNQDAARENQGSAKETQSNVEKSKETDTSSSKVSSEGVRSVDAKTPDKVTSE